MTIPIVLVLLFSLIATADEVGDGESINVTITYTPSTKTVCDDNGKCTKTLYSGVMFAYEDGVWKSIEEARDLLPYFNKKYIEKDPNFDIDILQLNYTDIGLNLSFNWTNWQSYPECFGTYTNENVHDIKCDFKISANFNNTSSKYQLKWQKKNGDIKTTTKWDFKGNPFIYNYTFGGNSTTIHLVDNVTENLEDTYVSEVAPDDNLGLEIGMSAGEVTTNTASWSYIKFNITSVPADQIIDDSKLCFFVYQNDYDTGETATSWVYSLDNQTWWEGNNTDDGSQICWNNRPSGATTLIDTNDTIDGDWDNFWLCFDVTSWVTTEYGLSKANISFIWNATLDYGIGDRMTAASKEYTDDISWRPYLNITYSSAGDSTNPTLTINDPDNTTYSSTNVSLNYNADDDTGLDKCWYSLDGGDTNTTIANCANTTFTGSTGSNTLNVYVNDTTGNLNNTESVSFSIDTTGPTVSISAPTNITYSSTNVTLTYTSWDINNISACQYELNGNSNVSLPTCWNSSFTATANQMNTIKVWSNDTLGNWGSHMVNFTIDATGPTVSISAPANMTYGATNVTLTYTSWDSNNISSCKYELNGNANVSLPDCINSSFTGTANQMNTVRVFSNDTFDNWAFDEINFTIDTTGPTVTITAPINITYSSTNITLTYISWDINNITSCVYEHSGSNTTVAGCINTTFTADEGNNSIKLWANDTFNNWNSSSVVYFTIDTTAPTVSITAPTNISYASTNATLTFDAWDINNITSCIYELSGINTTIIGCDNTTFTAIGGNNSIKVWANDTFNNWGISSIIYFTIDDTAPTISISAPTNITYGSTNVTLTYTAWDINNISSCVYELSGTNTTISNCINTTLTAVEGNNSIKMWANDTFNNWGVSSIVYFTIDTTAPTVSMTAPTNITYGSSNVTLTYTAWDINNISVCQYELNDANTTVASCVNTTFTATSGSNNIKVWANDTFGNVGVSSTIYFTYDDTAPTVSISAPTNISYGSTNVTLTFDAWDINNVTTCIYELNQASNTTINGCANTTFTGVSGNNSVKVWANDTFNNWGVSSVVYFTVDITAPTVSVTAPTNISYGSANTTLTFTAWDINNISECRYELNGANTTIPSCINTTFTAVSGNNSIKVWANDTFNNVGVSSVIYFTYDDTAPTVSVSAPTNITYGSTNVTLTFNAWDINNVSTCIYELSGANTTINNCANTTFTAVSGNNSIKVWANDTFDNWGVSSIVYFTIDITGPTASISAPTNTTYGSTNITLTYTAWDINNITSCRYEFNGTNTTVSSCENTTFLADEGSNYVKIWANDTFDNWDDSSTIYFTVDTTAPTISITAPDNITYSSTNVTLTYTSWDINNISACRYELNGGANVSLPNCINSSFLATADSDNTVKIWSNDTFVNLNSASVNFYIDTAGPTVSMAAPTNITYGSTNITLTFDAWDLNNVSVCKYEFNSTNTTIPSCRNTTFIANESSNYVKVWANDTFGNWDKSSTVYFTVNTTPPTVTLIAPTNITYGYTNVTLTFTAWDYYNISSCRYEFNSTNTTIPNCRNTSFTADEGSNYVEVWANNSLNTWNVSSTIYFTIDTTKPTMSLTMPINITYLYKNIVLEFTAWDDRNISSCKLELNDANETITNCANTTYTSKAEVGPNHLKVWANNTIDVWNATPMVYFTAEIPAPTGGGETTYSYPKFVLSADSTQIMAMRNETVFVYYDVINDGEKNGYFAPVCEGDACEWMTSIDRVYVRVNENQTVSINVTIPKNANSTYHFNMTGGSYMENKLGFVLSVGETVAEETKRYGVTINIMNDEPICLGTDVEYDVVIMNHIGENESIEIEAFISDMSRVQLTESNFYNMSIVKNSMDSATGKIGTLATWDEGYYMLVANLRRADNEIEENWEVIYLDDCKKKLPLIGEIEDFVNKILLRPIFLPIPFFEGVNVPFVGIIGLIFFGSAMGVWIFKKELWSILAWASLITVIVNFFIYAFAVGI